MRDQILLDAAHPLYCSFFADEWEERGGSFAPGSELTEVIDCYDEDPVKRERLLLIMRGYIQEIESSWGMSWETVFGYMEVEDPRMRSDMIYYCLMACVGHGIGLDDGEYDEELELFEEKTGSPLDTTPISTEMCEMRDLASEEVDRELLRIAEANFDTDCDTQWKAEIYPSGRDRVTGMCQYLGDYDKDNSVVRMLDGDREGTIMIAANTELLLIL